MKSKSEMKRLKIMKGAEPKKAKKSDKKSEKAEGKSKKKGNKPYFDRKEDDRQDN